MLSEEIISAFYPFNKLNKSQIKTLLKIASLKKYHKDEVIYKEGDKPDYFYFLLKGRIVAISTINDRKQEIELIKKGTPFGIISLFTGDPHSVTAKAIENCSVVRIEKDMFKSFIKKVPFLAFDFSRILSRRVKKRTNIPKRIFKSTAVAVIICSDYLSSLKKIIALTNLLKHNKKKVIIVETSSSKKFVLPSFIKESIKYFYIDKEFREELLIAKDSEENLCYLCLEMQYLLKDELISLNNFLLENYHFIFYVIRKEEFDYWSKLIEFVNQVYIMRMPDREDNKFISRLIKRIKILNTIGASIRIIFTQEVSDLKSAKGKYPHKEELCIILDDSDKDSYRRNLGWMERDLSENTLGLALGSGGAYGISHIGVIKALDENSIPLDMICGSSIGAIIAGMWALGYSLKEMEEAVSFIGRKINLFSFPAFSFPFKGIIRSKRLQKVLRDIFGKYSFHDTKYPLAIVAFNFKRREMVAIKEGLIYKAVSASCAMPGIFEPVIVKEDILLDGGVLSPLPTKVLLKSDIKKIIAVNVTPYKEEMRNIYRHRSTFNIFDFIFGSIETMQQEFIKDSIEIADIVIHPDLGDLNWTDFTKIKEFIKRGYETTLKKISEINNLLVA